MRLTEMPLRPAPVPVPALAPATPVEASAFDELLQSLTPASVPAPLPVASTPVAPAMAMPSLPAMIRPVAAAPTPEPALAHSPDAPVEDRSSGTAAPRDPGASVTQTDPGGFFLSGSGLEPGQAGTGTGPAGSTEIPSPDPCATAVEGEAAPEASAESPPMPVASDLPLMPRPEALPAAAPVVAVPPATPRETPEAPETPDGPQDPDPEVEVDVATEPPLPAWFPATSAPLPSKTVPPSSGGKTAAAADRPSEPPGVLPPAPAGVAPVALGDPAAAPPVETAGPLAPDPAAPLDRPTGQRPPEIAERSFAGSLTAQGPDASRATIRHIAVTVASQPDQSVEVSLGREELGTVRLVMRTADTAVTVQIVADRPDALDLMRRHAPELAADLRQMGFGDVSFSFSRDSRAGSPPPGAILAAFALDDAGGFAPPPAAAFTSPATGLSSGGLDLRL